MISTVSESLTNTLFLIIIIQSDDEIILNHMPKFTLFFNCILKDQVAAVVMCVLILEKKLIKNVTLIYNYKYYLNNAEEKSSFQQI